MRAIFITGGGSGIGRAVAQHFAARAWRVGLADIDEAGMDGTRALLGAAWIGSWQMDVRDREGWEATLDAFTGAAGRIDVLFNNAGIAVGGRFADASFDDLDRVIAINLVGVINGARIGHRHLKATPGSCLLNTASASAIYGSAGLAAYSATKFGVRALTEALDGEWAADGIRVRSIMPGFIDTPLLHVAIPGSNRTARESVIESGLEFTPVEAVAAAAWDAVHGDRLHTPVGKTARRMTFAARWLPGSLRQKMRERAGR